jgi:hypothetical protein
VSSSLKAVQSSAKGWQTALTAILGLVTVVSLVGGRSTLQMLSGAMQAWIVIFAAVAVAANAWGIYKSTLVLSSALAFVAGIVAVGFVWLAPNATPPAVTVDLMIRPPAPSPGATAAVPVAVCGVLPTPQPTGSHREAASCGRGHNRRWRLPRCRRSWWRGRVEPGSVRDDGFDLSRRPMNLGPLFRLVITFLARSGLRPAPEVQHIRCIKCVNGFTHTHLASGEDSCPLDVRHFCTDFSPAPPHS